MSRGISLWSILVAVSLQTAFRGVTCQNGDTTVSSAVMSGNVPMPPEISSPRSSAQVVVTTSTLSIKCEAKGFPTPRISWFRDNVQITPDKYIEIDADGTLKFLDFVKRENGLYYCTATNNLGTSKSISFHITGEIKPEWNSTVTMENIRKDAGRPFSIPCRNMPEMLPKLHIRWYDSKSEQLPPSDRITKDTRGTLHFSYLVTGDSGEYLCGLAPEKVIDVSNIYMKKMASLTVNSAAIVNFKPSLLFTSDIVKATIGKPAELDCFFGGRPIVNVQWRGSRDISGDDPRYELRNFGQVLIIKEVKEEDRGVYTCTGANSMGNIVQSVRLNVTSPPMPVQYGALINQILTVGSRAKFNCTARPPTDQNINTPLWYRNTKSLGTGQNFPDLSRYSFNQDQTQLTIDKLQKADTACFQCQIDNSEGFLYYDSYLKVIDPIVVSGRPQDVVTVRNDTYAELTLSATGDTCCQLDKRLLFNGELMDTAVLSKPPFQLVGSLNSGRLFLNASTVSSAVLKSWMGSYKYRIYNPYQEESISFTMELFKAPEPIADEPAAASLWWIGIIVAVVALIVIVIIICVVYKNKNPGETYQLARQEIKHNLDPEKDLMDQSFQEF